MELSKKIVSVLIKEGVLDVFSSLYKFVSGSICDHHSSMKLNKDMGDHEFNSSKKTNIGGGGDLLCEELIEEILSRLPFASLFMCKYVSKSWRHLVSNVCHRRGPTVGLIALYSNVYPVMSKELRLLHPTMKQEDDDDNDNQVKKKEKECIMETTKRWNLYHVTELLDSCNGLILCRCLDRVDRYYVGNPILNQWTLLPPSSKQDYHYHAAKGFAFDGIQGQHYKILHLNRSETKLTTNRIKCQIFSSETGRWREHQATILNSLSTLSHCIRLNELTQKYGLYRNGVLHWTFARDHRYMLVFYVEKEVFRFMELPGNHDHDSSEDRVAKCLWESKGFLQYAVAGVDNSFHVWKNMNDDDKQHIWVYIQTIKFLSMVQVNLKDPRVLICTYRSTFLFNTLCVATELNSASRVVNLGTILTYLSSNGVLDEKMAKMLRVNWRYMSREDEGEIIRKNKFTGTIYPYVFNLVDLPIWDGCKLLKHPNE